MSLWACTGTSIEVVLFNVLTADCRYGMLQKTLDDLLFNSEAFRIGILHFARFILVQSSVIAILNVSDVCETATVLCRGLHVRCLRWWGCCPEVCSA